MSDQYELFEPIGRGHYGVLHRGHDLSLDRPVAVRIFDPRFVPDIKSRRKDLLNLSVSRPRSVAAHHLDRERAWLVMELLGGNLADEAAHGPITAERLRTVLAQTLEGLEALHSEGLLHAALKPTNLLRDAGGSIKLSDSRNLRYDDAPGGPTLAEMPLPSHAHGPLGKWTAPELLDPYFGAVGPALDFYNLGVLGFELLVGPRFDSMVLGRSAPTRDADLSWMRWHQSRGKSLPPALELAPRLPADLTAVLDRLVRKPVGERYASAAEALRDLNSRTVTGLPCSALPVEQPQSPSPEPLRRVEGPRRLFGGPVRGRKSLSRTVGARWFALALPPLVALVTMTAWMGNRPNPPTRSRTVVILSEPPGVEVTLDGARLPGRTPYRLPVSLGAHTVGLKLRGHQDTSERVDVPPGDGPLELGPFTLSKRISLARVRIKASPTPDRISLENVRTGVSRSFEEPAFQVTAGEYRIALERAGYRTFRDSFHLDAEARELDLGPFRLVRASRPVRIPCDPPGARIRIAGESFERTAGDVFDLGLGPHEITIVKDGYRAKVFPFELTEGEGIFEPPLIQLDQFSRRARIVGNAIGARVELDGRYSGIVTDAGIDVPLGTVKLSLTRNGFQPFERMLTVVRGDGDLILEATLPPVRRVTSIYRGIGNREVVNLYETEPLAEGP